MTLRTQTRLFASHADAAAALHDLAIAGFSLHEASLIGGTADLNVAGHTGGVQAPTQPRPGGGAGLPARLGTLERSGPGPLAGLGWLVPTLADLDRASEDLVGSLTASGVKEQDARDLAEGLRHGGTIVAVRTDEARSGRAETILANHLAVHEARHAAAGASPDGETSAILAAPAPGTPGNPPGR